MPPKSRQNRGKVTRELTRIPDLRDLIDAELLLDAPLKVRETLTTAATSDGSSTALTSNKEVSHDIRMPDIDVAKNAAFAKAALLPLRDNAEAIIDILNAVDFSPEVREAVFVKLGGAARTIISPAEGAIFSKIELLGKDEKARIAVEKQLSKLEGVRATKPLADRLHDFLKERGWGVATEIGIPGTISWLQNPKRPCGGYMRIRYKDPATNETKTACAFAELPKLRIVRLG